MRLPAAILALAVAASLTTPALAVSSATQARQIKSLRAQIAKDNATIRALRAPITTPAAAWTKITSLAWIFAPTLTANCGENYYVLPQLLVVPGVQVYSSYTFAQSDVTGQPWCP